jgi:hypothetical protein
VNVVIFGRFCHTHAIRLPIAGTLIHAPFYDIGRAKMASLADNIKETVTWFFHSSNNANELLYSEQDYQEALAKCR